MISPSARCSQFYRHYKITTVSVPIGPGSSAGVTMTTYIYNPSVSATDPVTSYFNTYPSFDTIADFEIALQQEIQAAHPIIDGYIGSEHSMVGSASGINVDLPDPLQQDLYRGHVFGGSIPGSGRLVSTPPTPVGFDPTYVIPGKDPSGQPGYPQTTFADPNYKTTYATIPFGQSSPVTDKNIKMQSQRGTHTIKRYRKGLGVNESVADVVNNMARILDVIDANRIRYIKPGSNTIENESRNNTLDRLLGLETTQVPMADMYNG